MSNVATTITGSTSRSLEERVESLEAAVINLQKGACNCSSTITLSDSSGKIDEIEKLERRG